MSKISRNPEIQSLQASKMPQNDLKDKTFGVPAKGMKILAK